MVDLNKYAQESGYFTQEKPEDDRYEFTKGVTSALKSTVAGGKALVGSVIGDDNMQLSAINDMRNNADENAGKVGRIEDINGVGDFTDWLSYNLGSGTASIATMVGSGGLGGLAVKGLAKGALVNATKGAAATAAGFTPNYGESLQNAYDATGEIKNQAAFASASIKTALDMIVPAKLMKAGIGKEATKNYSELAKQKMINDKGFTTWAKEMLNTGKTEAFTEGLQTYTDQVMVNVLTDAENPLAVRDNSEIFNAMASGAAGSMGFGVYGGVQRNRNAQTLRDGSTKTNDAVDDLWSMAQTDETVGKRVNQWQEKRSTVAKSGIADLVGQGDTQEEATEKVRLQLIASAKKQGMTDASAAASADDAINRQEMSTMQGNDPAFFDQLDKQQTNYDVPAAARNAGATNDLEAGKYGEMLLSPAQESLRTMNNQSPADMVDEASNNEGFTPQDRAVLEGDVVPKEQSQSLAPQRTYTGINGGFIEGEVTPEQAKFPTDQETNQRQSRDKANADFNSQPAQITDKNIVYGQDNTREIDGKIAQEKMVDGIRNQPKQITDKNIVFAEDASESDKIHIKANGKPFKNERLLKMSRGHKEAAKKNKAVEIVDYEGGLAWRYQSENEKQSTHEEGGNIAEKSPEVTNITETEKELPSSENTYEPEKGKGNIANLEVVEVPVGELSLSNDVPQFKSGANEKGVVEPLGGKFDRTGVSPIQVWVRKDGRKEVISGRHRTELAQRSGEQTIPAQYHYEENGFDKYQAAALDAILNVREGQGKVKDYVDFIKHTGLTEAEATEQGILARATGKRAYTIASQGSDTLITAHRNNGITDEAAVRISKAAPNDEALQAVGIKAIDDGKTIAVAENMVKAVKSFSSDQEQGSGDLFGFDDSAMIEAENLAKAASKKQAEIQRSLSAIQGAAKRPDLAKKEGVNVKNPKAVQKRIEQLKEDKRQWDNWHTNPELVAQLKDKPDIPQEQTPQTTASQEVVSISESQENNVNDTGITDATQEPDMFGGANSDQASIKEQSIISSADNAKKDTEKTNSEKSETKEAQELNENLQSPPSEQIDDFGEKLGGARKDVWGGFAEKLDDNTNIKTEPLSKSLPQPDYEKMAEEGVNPEHLAFIAIARDSIKAKPRASYKIGSWVKHVENVKSQMKQVLNNEIDTGKAFSALSLSSSYGSMNGAKDAISVIAKAHPSKLKDVAGYRITSGSYSMFKGVKYNPSKTMFNIEKKGTRFNFDSAVETLEEAQKNLLTIIEAENKATTKKGKHSKVSVYRNRATGDTYLGWKGGSGILKIKSFESTSEARSYLENNRDDIEETLQKMKSTPNMRKPINAEREGPERSADNVTPSIFGDAFGFRGVEFGNWVDQGKRQKDLNQAYDSLMDLAEALDIPPKALSLNGQLGLAFGARGKGGKNPAAAHYEPGTVVINLTKKAGSGSLAHEWWHALDNYFGKQRNKTDFITDSPYSLPSEEIRPEMARAFKAVRDVINDSDLPTRSNALDQRRSKPYWSTVVEMTARSFETFIINKLGKSDISNDYLANVVSDEAWSAAEALGFEDGSTYPYPKQAEQEKINDAYQALFDTIEHKKTDDGVALFSRDNTNSSTTVSETEANQVVESIIKNWVGNDRANDFVVVSTFDDLPKSIKDAAKDQGAENDVRGVFHKGKTYLVRDKLANAQDVEATIFHETYGHHGIRKLFGKDIEQKLNQLLVGIGGINGLDKIAKKYGIDLNAYKKGLAGSSLTNEQAQTILMDELLAHLAQNNKPSIMRKVKEIIGAIRQWLKKSGFVNLHNTSDSELFYILKQARNAVKGNTSKGADSDIRFAQNKNTATEDDYDLDFPLTHQGGEIDTIKNNGLFGGIFASAGYESKGGPNVGGVETTFYLPKNGEVAGSGDSFVEDYAHAVKWLKKEVDPVDPLTDEEYETLYDIVMGDENIFDLDTNPLEKAGFDDIGEASWEAQRLRGKYAASLGYDAVKMSDEHGVSYLIPYGSRAIKSSDISSDIRFSRVSDIKDKLTPKKLSDSLIANEDEGKINKLIRHFQDKFRPLKTVQKIIEKSGRTISDSANAYVAEELFHGKTEEDLRQMERDHVQPLVDALTKHKIEMTELDLYLIAKHAKERNAYVSSKNDAFDGESGSGMTNDEAQAILDRVNSEGKTQALDEVAEKVYAMTAARREVLNKNGLLSDGELDSWESSYDFYVPLKGFAQDERDSDNKSIPRVGKGFAISGNESIRALGRRTMAASPSTQVIQDLTESIIRHRKNEVGNAFLKLVQSNPDHEFWQVFTDNNPEIDRRYNKQSGRVEETKLPMAMLSDRYFTTKVDGETYYIKIADERLMNAMKNLGVDKVNGVIQTLGTINRYLSTINTSLNPEFVISNMARDIQTAVFNVLAEQDLPQGKIKGKDIAGNMIKDWAAARKGIALSLGGKPQADGKAGEYQQLFDQFREDGAKTGYFDMKNIDQQVSDLNNMLEMAGDSKKGIALRAKKTVGDFVENINQSVENAVRLSAYKQALDAGVSRQKAASLAKNLTVNFNRKGEVGTTMNAIYMFANASVQGTAQFLRSMQGYRDQDGNYKFTGAQKVAAGFAAGAMVLAALNRAFSDEDDDGVSFWDKVPDHIKERNIVVMKSVFGVGAPGEYYSIPLPYGYNIFSVFGTSVESIFQGEKTVAQASGNMVGALIGSFSPIGAQDSDSVINGVVKSISPTILSPFVQLAVNENFYGGQIYRENYQFGTQKPDSSLAKRGTHSAYKAISSWLNEATGGSYYQSGIIDINPEIFAHLIDFSTGAAGTFATRSVNAATKAASGEKLEPREIPFYRKLNGETNDDWGDQDKFYERSNKIKQVVDEYSSLKGNERIEFKRDNESLIMLTNHVKTTEKQLRNLRKRYKIIEANTELSKTAKSKQLDMNRKQQDRLVDKFNARYSAINK